MISLCMYVPLLMSIDKISYETSFFFYLEPLNEGKSSAPKMKVGGCYIILTTLINAHHWFPQQPAPLKRPSAADIIGRRSQPTSSPQTLPAPPTSRSLPPAATPGKTSPPASPPLEVSSPLNPPKQALLSTASISVFEHFKKQALEKNERVSCAVQIEVDSVSVCVLQDRLAKQQEVQRKEQRRQAGLEAQRKKEELQSSPSQQSQSPPATPSPAGSVEDSESRQKQRERQREEQRKKREAVGHLPHTLCSI